MKPPRDVKREDFVRLLEQNKGMSLLKTRRSHWWRDFWFLVDDPSAKKPDSVPDELWRAGITVIYSLQCKFERFR
jgi:hypothetical protein